MANIIYILVLTFYPSHILLHEKTTTKNLPGLWLPDMAMTRGWVVLAAREPTSERPRAMACLWFTAKSVIPKNFPKEMIPTVDRPFYINHSAINALLLRVKIWKHLSIQQWGTVKQIMIQPTVPWGNAHIKSRGERAGNNVVYIIAVSAVRK